MENAAAYTGGSQLPRRSFLASTDCFVGLRSRQTIYAAALLFFTKLQREPVVHIKYGTVRASMKHNDLKQLTPSECIISKFFIEVLNTVRAMHSLTGCFIMFYSRYSFNSRACEGCE